MYSPSGRVASRQITKPPHLQPDGELGLAAGGWGIQDYPKQRMKVATRASIYLIRTDSHSAGKNIKWDSVSYICIKHCGYCSYLHQAERRRAQRCFSMR